MNRLLSFLALSLMLVLCPACPGSDDDPSDATEADVATNDTATTDDVTPPGSTNVITKTCSMVAACLSDARIGLYADKCFADLYMELSMASTPDNEFGRLVTCAASSTTCKQFVACDRMGATYACKSPADSACVGDAFVECESSGSIKRVYDCATAAGMACVPGKGCSSGTTCTATSRTCDGSTAITCVDGEEERRFDCAAGDLCLNGMCLKHATASATCSPGAVCDGSTLVLCSQGYEIRTDCADFGRTCEPGQYACVAAATECVGRTNGMAQPSEITQDTCEGSIITTCMDGRLVQIDCSTLGEQGTCGLGTTLAGDTRGVCQ